MEAVLQIQVLLVGLVRLQLWAAQVAIYQTIARTDLLPQTSKPLPDNHLFQHASTVQISGRVVLFTGDSGSGKTTIMNIAQKHGYLCYGDELSKCIRKQDGSWALSASGTTVNKVLSPEFYSDEIPVGLMVHVRSHLEEGFRINHCSPMESVVIGFRSAIATGQHTPSVRASRFRTYSDFVRKVPSVILDFSLNSDFLPALEAYIN